MRELKFRAWSVDSYIELINLRRERSIYFSPYDLGGILPEARVNVVIEQYTGLKDKNGKEIYEGDIVKSSYRITGDSEPIYTYHLVEWEVQPMDDYCGDITVGLWLPDTNEAIEVVGNIHENPELLEEK